MTMQYEQRNINLQGAQAVSSLIYNAGAAQQTDIVFNDWEAMLVKAQEIPGIKEIIVGGSGVQDVPAGTYDMTDIRLIGEDAFSNLGVDGVVFENLIYIENLTITAGAAADNVVSTFQYGAGATDTLTFLDVNFALGALSTAPMFILTAGAIVGVIAKGSSFISANAGVPVIVIDATSALVAQNLDGVAGNNWGGVEGSPAFVVVSPGGAFTLGLATGDTFWESNQGATGPTTINRAQDYESADVADWAGTEPGNVKNALDRIAAALGPIA